jgi:hypothetical protein
MNLSHQNADLTVDLKSKKLPSAQINLKALQLSDDLNLYLN